MNDGIYGLAEWPIKRHLEAWRKAHKGKARRVKIGDFLILPPSNQSAAQRFTVSSIFFRYPLQGKKRKMHITWSSHCAVCGAPYDFYKVITSRSLVRTCPAHRGHKPRHAIPRPPKPAKAPYKPETPLRDMVLACLADCALVAPQMALRDFLAYCVDQMIPPAEGRDTRKQCALGALRLAERRGAIPQGVELGDNVLNFADWCGA